MQVFAIQLGARLRSLCSSTLILAGLTLATVPLHAQKNEIEFDLSVNPKFVSCLGNSSGLTPTAHVKVTRGSLNDTLQISGSNFKTGLGFDLFTIQRSNLLADGTVNPNFTNFGLSWYQSDLEADSHGNISTTLKTILLDQIFGFDADISTTKFPNTFHVGFWFNNPNDANVDGCTFDVTHPTPFNGEHKAGPNAMISLPDPDTNLGPLCTNPNFNTKPVSCNP